MTIMAYFIFANFYPQDKPKQDQHELLQIPLLQRREPKDAWCHSHQPGTMEGTMEPERHGGSLTEKYAHAWSWTSTTTLLAITCYNILCMDDSFEVPRSKHSLGPLDVGNRE